MTNRWLLDTSALLALRDEEEGAVLVHKDPAFRPLVQVSQEWLG